MPIVAILLGAVLIDLGVRGSEHLFGQQLEQDFGQGRFLAWAATIVGLGAIGYSKTFRGVSTAGLALVLIVMVVVNGSQAFPALASFIENPPSPTPAVPLPTVNSSSSSTGSSIGGTIGSLFGGLF